MIALLIVGALALAACAGIGDGYRKVLLNQEQMLPELTILVMYVAFAGSSAVLVLCAAGLPSFAGINWLAWIGFLIGMPLMLWTYYRGIKASGLTLVLPVMAFAPAVSMLGEWVLLGQSPTPLYFLGVVVAAIGGYLLGVAELKRAHAQGKLRHVAPSWRAPVLALAHDQGVRSVGYAVLGFFFVGPWQKLAFEGFLMGGNITLPGLAVLMLGESLACGLLFGAVLYYKRTPAWRILQATPTRMIINAGLPWVAHLWLLYVGFAYTMPSYVLTVRSMGIVFSTVFAARVFKEPWRQRAPAMAVIVVGVALVTLFGQAY